MAAVTSEAYVGETSGTPLWKYLRHRLNTLGMSMVELGRRSGVKTQTIYKWVENTPNPQSINRIAAALGEEPTHMLTLAGHLQTGKKSVKAPPDVDLATAIRRNPTLTETQKRVLVDTLRAFQAANELDRPKGRRRSS